MQEAQRQNQVRLLNQQPINQACQQLAPPDWREGVGCLNLLEWGVRELEAKVVAAGLEPDSLQAMVNRLVTWPPREAQEWLLGPDQADVPVESLPKDREEAAMFLVDLLNSRMIENG